MKPPTLVFKARAVTLYWALKKDTLVQEHTASESHHKSASRISNCGSAITNTCHLTLCLDVHIWNSNCLWCVDDKEGFILPI